MHVNNDRTPEEKSDIVLKHALEEEAENDEEVLGFFLPLLLNAFLSPKCCVFYAQIDLCSSVHSTQWMI